MCASASSALDQGGVFAPATFQVVRLGILQKEKRPVRSLQRCRTLKPLISYTGAANAEVRASHEGGAGHAVVGRNGGLGLTLPAYAMQCTMIL